MKRKTASRQEAFPAGTRSTMRPRGYGSEKGSFPVHRSYWSKPAFISSPFPWI
jgi:hypothetical protein